jgi:lipopolysaccharide transport system ATP-binding protein
MTTAIRIENVSKLYRLGTVGTGTIAHDLNRWWHQIRGKEDPYAKVGQVNDRTKAAKSEEQRGEGSERGADDVTALSPSPAALSHSSSSLGSPPSALGSRASGPDYVWALRDINLEVQQGEILGIIGRNGAGKSTLLKLLSRVTAPTTGSIKTKGRIASLLEVGTGFHPDLTGRENIYMNGAILGMRRHEITRQLDEIVDFSGCAKYLDTPVKRYSSGMTVRLGFAVAASLKTDILVIDEVLAVGDVEFQKKCLGRMSEVSASEGRTVLFVSHNMGAMAQLCRNGVLMETGQFILCSDIESAINGYLELGKKTSDSEFHNTAIDANLTKAAYVRRMRLMDQNGKTVDSVTTNHPIRIDVEFCIQEYKNGMELSVSLQDKHGGRIFTIHEPIDVPSTLFSGQIAAELVIPDNVVTPGSYAWIVAIHIPGAELIDAHFNVCNFTVIDGGTKFSRYHPGAYGYVFVNNYSAHFVCSAPSSR